MTPSSLESRRFRIELDPATGWIRSFVDKDHDLELCAGPMNVPLVLDDPSDTWSHGVDAYRQEVGAFHLVREPEVFQVGAAQGILRLVMGFETSIIEQYIVLYQDLAEVAFRTAIDWRQRHQVLKVAFPLAVADPTVTFETAYGHTVRQPLGDEQPHHRWLDVTGHIGGTSYGVGLINDSKYGCDVLGAEMRLTLLRSPIYAFHDPQKPQAGELYEYTDQGLQTVIYGLVPHLGDWRDSDLQDRAAALNAPLFCLVEPPHDGPDPAAGSALSSPGACVRMEVLKVAEDGDGLLLRGYERTGREERVALSFLGHDLGEVTFGPHQIRSWRLRPSGDGSWRLAECDLLERPR